jgi:hypothetical protein
MLFLLGEVHIFHPLYKISNSFEKKVLLQLKQLL